MLPRAAHRTLRAALLLGLLAPVLATCGSGFPKTVVTSKGAWNSVCPRAFEDVDAGAFCADAGAFDAAPETRPICDYAEGYCGCEQEGGSFVWRCRPDPSAAVCPYGRRETPIKAGDPCDQLGKICSYDAGEGCFQSFTCSGGRWASAGAACHGSSAPM